MKKKENKDNYLNALTISMINSLLSEQEVKLLNSVDNDEKREKIINAISVLHPEYNLPRKNVVCDSYPNIKDQNIAAKVILNMPVGVGLTKREKHLWLLDGARKTPINFLLDGTGLEARSINVARWLIKILQNEEQKEALFKTRRDGKLSEHTIDLEDSDCISGVNEAIARRADRMAVAQFGAEKLCQKPEWLKTLGGRVRLLDTAPALAEDGREMSHCVGGYASNVKSGRSIIVAIRAWGHKATVEYNEQKQIVQIKGKANSNPSKICHRLAQLAVSDKPVKKTVRKSVKRGGVNQEQAQM